MSSEFHGAFQLRVDRALTHPQVISLLEEHLTGMRAASPPECVFALDLAGLRQPDITFLTAWRCAAPEGADPSSAEELVAIGALKELSPTSLHAGGHGELKSMRTSSRHLRQGAGQTVLQALLDIAKQRGYSQVSLETGSAKSFAPAIAMYRRVGFVECGPFAEYLPSPFSRFMMLQLCNVDRAV